MDLETFRDSLNRAQPPNGLSLSLTGLWWDAKHDWEKAHEFAQQDETPSGAWVHAYLHRKEGDSSNAAYWYRRAGKPPFHGPLAAEWETIVQTLLSSPE